MPRTLSPAGVHLIASFEGFVPTPYNDAAGNATIGYGHLLHAGGVTAADRERDYVAELHLTHPSTPGRLTAEQAIELLHADTSSYARAVDGAVRVRLGVLPGRADARFGALCSLAFNIGAGAFAGSTLLREINQRGAPRDWSSLGPAWLAWDHAGGQVLPGLLNRRRREFAIFAAGRFPAV